MINRPNRRYFLETFHGVADADTYNPSAWNPNYNAGFGTYSKTNFTNDTATNTIAAGAAQKVMGSLGHSSSGKWYFEIAFTVVSIGIPRVGIMIVGEPVTLDVGSSATGWAYAFSGFKLNNNVSTAYGASFNGSNVVGVLVDHDNNTLSFSKDGVSQGVAFTNVNGAMVYPALSNTRAGSARSYILRTDASVIQYLPSGYRPWS